MKIYRQLFVLLSVVYFSSSCGQSPKKPANITNKKSIFDSCEQKINAIRNSDWDLPLVVFRGCLPTYTDSIIYTDTKKYIDRNGVSIAINDFRSINNGNNGTDTTIQLEIDKTNNGCDISINFIISEQHYDENGEDTRYAPAGYKSRYINNYSTKVYGRISTKNNNIIFKGEIKDTDKTKTVGYLKGIITEDWKYMKLMVHLYDRKIPCLLKSGTSSIEQLIKQYDEKDYNAVKMLKLETIDF